MNKAVYKGMYSFLRVDNENHMFEKLSNRDANMKITGHLHRQRRWNNRQNRIDQDGEGGGEEEGNVDDDMRNRNNGNVAEGEEHDDDDGGGGKAKEDEDGKEEEATREDEAGAEVTFAL